MLLSIVLPFAHAVEGMWLPEALPVDAVRAAGFALPAAKLTDPQGDVLGAIVHVGDWCSGAFVGDEGLVLTNHHCVWDLLQHEADAEHPYVEAGYAAASPAQERWGGPEARLSVVESTQDVTATMVAAARRAPTDLERARALDRAATKLVARCERAPDRRCEVTAEYGGTSWRLVTQRVLRDVRLVYVPPMSVGEFGGDRDNFEWPRHDADFAVLRAYVSPDGSSSGYDPANVPYHPPHALSLNASGVGPGAFVAAAGYPYETQRYELFAQLRHRASVAYPDALAHALAREAILTDEAERDPAAAAALGEERADLANGRKYLQGVIDNVASGSPIRASPPGSARLFSASEAPSGASATPQAGPPPHLPSPDANKVASSNAAEDRAVRSGSVLGRKAAEEAGLRVWIAADPDRRARYGPAVAELDALVAASLATWARDGLLLDDLSDSPLLATARTLVHAAVEREKRDADREPGFQARDREDLLAELDGLDDRLWLPADRRQLELLRARAAALPADQHLAALDTLDVAALYDHPALTDAATRRALLDTRLADLRRSPDPWIRLALALEPDAQAAADRRSAFTGALSRLAPVWMAARRELHPGATYPDANNTLRVTFGTVEGYTPRDAVVYTPQTTVAGFVAKVDSGLYDAPPAAFVTAARASRSSPLVDPGLGDVPVNFLTDLDSTGGNSGSATVDRDGRLVGLLFDGNYESMAADWIFDPATTRSIHLDVRYLLFVLESDPAARWVAEALRR